MRGALAHSAERVILNLGEVTSRDATGLAVLVGTHRRAAGAGIILYLAAPRPQVAQLLRITGLDRILTVHPTVHDATTRPEHVH